MRSPRFRLHLLLCLTVFTSLWAAPAARGQGTSGTFADPISTRDLQQYGERLGMSEQQQQAVEPFHSAYMESFRKLRENEIETYLRDTASLRGPGAMRATREEAVAAVEGMTRLNGRIESLDNTLFNQVQGVLTDEQVTMMPRIRQSRERERYQTGMSRFARFLNPASFVDLSESIDELELTPEQITAIDPIIRSYESKITDETKSLYDRTNNMSIELLDQMQALGFDENAMTDPEKRREFFTAFQNIWSTMIRTFAELAADLSDVNRSALNQLTSVLPPKEGRKLRSNYFAEAYSDAWSGKGDPSLHFRAALALDNITSEQAAAIHGIEEGYYRIEQNITNDTADLIDERRRSGAEMRFGPRGRDDEAEAAREAHRSKLNEQRESLNNAAQRAINDVLAILNADQSEQVTARIGEEIPKQTAEGAITVTVTDGGESVVAFRKTSQTENEENRLSDPFLPGPIARNDLETYARLLSLDDEQKVVVDSLYEDYFSAYSEAQHQSVPEINDLTRKLRWRFGDDDDDDRDQPTEQDVDRLYNLRSSTFARMQELDSEFFDNMEITLIDDAKIDAVQRLRLMRKRETFNRETDGGSIFSFGRRGRRGGDGESQEAGVDISTVVWSLNNPPALGSEADQLLLSYEQSMTGMIEQMYNLSLRMHQAVDTLRVEQQEEGDGDGRRWASRFREIMETVGRDSRNKLRDLVNLNRTTLEQLTQNLPATTATELKQAYNRKAFVDIYDDPRSVESALARAFDLQDLTFEQRSQLSELATEYRNSYEDLSQQMVEIESAERPEDGDFRNFDSRRAHRQNLERLRFDRDDLNDRTRIQIQAILTDQQQAAAMVTSPSTEG